ncbi:unnamed protein product [Urochloa humidicola]
MCSIAPFLLPGLAGAASVLDVRPTTYAEDVLLAWGGYSYYEDVVDINTLLSGINVILCPPNTVNPQKPSMDFLTLSRRLQRLAPWHPEHLNSIRWPDGFHPHG